MFFFRSTKPNMSSKIVGWLVKFGMANFRFLKKSKRKKNSEINLKKGNPTFLPDYPHLEVQSYLKGEKRICIKSVMVLFPFCPKDG